MTTPLESRLRKLSLPVPAGFKSRVKADARAVGDEYAAAERPSTTNPIPRRRVLGLAAALATVVVGLLVAHSLWGAQPGSGKPTAAQKILLAASKRAAQEGGTGTYWRTTISSGVIEEVGDPSNRYKIVERFANDDWIATAAGGQSVETIQQNGAEPWTGKDREAWQRAGSPSHWQNAKGGPIEAAGRPSSTSILPDGMRQFQVTVGIELSLEQVRQLPADRASLERQLSTWYGQARSHYAQPPGQQDWTFEAITDLLRSPISSPVRASLLELLSTLPRVTSLGNASDDLGRLGKGIAYTANPDPVLKVIIQSQLIIDAGTGSVLGERQVMVKPGDPAFKYASWAKPGDEISFWVATTNGYTNEAPPPPTPPIKG